MKVLNVFGIIFAWILSIVLIVALMVTPLILSTLSLLKPETITDALIDAIGSSNEDASSSAKEDGMIIESVPTEGVQITLLSTSSKTAESKSSSSIINADMVKDVLGVEVDEKGLEKVLASDAINELLGAYTEDLTEALAGNGKSNFDANKVKRIVDENMDEIVDVLQDVSPELAAKSKEELRNQIQTTVDERADKFVEALPKAEQIKEELVDGNPAVETALAILAKKDTLKWVVIGAVALLAVIIFFLRFPGFRGLRWLAVDLFVAGGLGGVLCAVLKVAEPIILKVVADDSALKGVFGALLSKLANGMIWRTAVILGCGVVLLVGYIVLKKVRKVAAEEEVSFQALMEEVEIADAETEEIAEETAAEIEAAEETAVVEEV